MPPILILPGLWNSGPQHWQSQWERLHPDWRRVEQCDWGTPDCTEWVATLEAAVRACPRPPVLVGHSLACVLISRWAMLPGRAPAAGAFLVAPSDVDAPSYPSGTTGFTPMPLARLPFPSLVVASDDDVYASLPRAQVFATAWGSELKVLSKAGHINADAGYGPWPEGEQWLLAFCERLLKTHQ